MGVFVSTPRRSPSYPCRRMGSVNAVEWCTRDPAAVNWLRFVPSDSTPEWLESAARFEEDSGLRMSGQFILERGEYITAMRGRAEASGSAASWVKLVTSTNRCVTIGCEDSSFTEYIATMKNNKSPAFSFVAEPDHEICDVVLHEGCISDFRQRRVAE